MQQDLQPQIAEALASAQLLLEHAYCLSCSGYCEQEPWAIALADSLHHCQESLQKLEQDHAES